MSFKFANFIFLFIFSASGSKPRIVIIFRSYMFLYVVARVAISKCHRLGGLSNRNVFLRALEPGKS